MPVEYQLLGGSERVPVALRPKYPWTSDLNITLKELSEPGPYSFHVVARDSLGRVSGPSNAVAFEVDLTPPEGSILAPEEGDVITGQTMIGALCLDANPAAYYVEFRSIDDTDWDYIVHREDIVDPPVVYAAWDTRGLVDGEYYIRVTFLDEAGMDGHTEVIVTLANAHPTVSPTDIEYSFENPENPNEVMLTVVIRNHGSSPAFGLDMDVDANGRYIGTVTDIDVDAHSNKVVHTTFEVNGSTVVTVRVRSDLYDTGEMEGGRLVTRDDALVGGEGSGSAATSVAWTGDLALVISLVALGLGVFALTGRGRPDKGKEG
jgi:hypothetical protein